MTNEEQLKELEDKVANAQFRKDKAIKEWSFLLASEMRQELIEAQLELLEFKKVLAVNNQNYSEAGEYLNEQRQLRRGLNS